MKKIFTIILLCALFLCSCTVSPPPSSPPAPAPSVSALPSTPAPSPLVSSAPIAVSQQSGAPVINIEDYPRVDGSTAALPLAIGLMCKITGVDEKTAEAKTKFNTTDNSYLNLLYSSVDLLLVYAPSSETQATIDATQVNLDKRAIGKDALVFIANEKNPVNSLTTEQLRDIYSGRIKNWKEVGGEDKPILAFQRPLNSGSQTLMLKLIMKDTPIISPITQMVEQDMGSLIERLVEYTNSADALGYSVYYYAKNMFARPELKFLAADGVMPSNETIKSGEYPHINDFYGIINESTPNVNAKKILDWLTTDEGQKFIEEYNYVSVK